MKKIMLNGEWNLRGRSADAKVIELTGKVPGCVHTDLMNNKIIDNPLVEKNSLKCQWIEKETWIYEKNFTVSDMADECYLVFEMLDVYCDVYLNGKKLGFCDDMFYPHRFDVSRILIRGENILRVIFYSPVTLTENKPRLKGAFTRERMYTRRIQCTYGWDWVDRFVSVGICKDVMLITPDACEIDNICITTTNIDKFSAQIKLDAAFSKICENCFAHIKIFSPDGTLIFDKHRLIVEDFMSVTVDIKNPKLWFPTGYGEPYLYKTIVSAEKEDGVCISKKESSFGIRTVKILQLEDEPESKNYKKCLELKKMEYLSGKNEKNDMNKHYYGFIVIINEIPIMCKGANWVPSEPFVSSETSEKITKILELSHSAGMNLIRVWGGGIFESTHFYDECDRLGIMVCQDFLMACGNYPETDAHFCENIKKEAEYITVELRNHPCLIWWSGDNENAADCNDDMPGYPGRSVVRKVIEPVVRKNDPGRYFFPSSPFGGIPYGSVCVGTTHNTKFLIPKLGYFIESDMADYQKRFADSLSRFGVEEPILGAPSRCSVEKFTKQTDFTAESEQMWRFHTKNNTDAFKKFEIYDCITAGAQKLFGAFKGIEDKLFKMQYLQYEWVRITMESYRRNKWFSSGLLYWMLNDCYPAFGWALIDYYCLPKAGWYAFKRSAKSVIASFYKKGGTLQIYVCNDSVYPAEGELDVYCINDKTVKKTALSFVQDANTSGVVYEIGIDENDENFVWVCDLKCQNTTDRAVWFSKRIKDVKREKPKVNVISQTDESIVVESKTYVHSVRLEADAIFEDNYFPMLAGEKRRIYFKANKGMTDVKIDAM